MGLPSASFTLKPTMAPWAVVPFKLAMDTGAETDAMTQVVPSFSCQVESPSQPFFASSFVSIGASDRGV